VSPQHARLPEHPYLVVLTTFHHLNNATSSLIHQTKIAGRKRKQASAVSSYTPLSLEQGEMRGGIR